MTRRTVLPAVLAALTDTRQEEWGVDAFLGCIVLTPLVAARHVPFGPRVSYERSAKWTTTDPDKAWEILDARGLLPPDGARGFLCRRCQGRGRMANGSWEYAEFDFCDVCAVEDVSATGGLRARGWTDVPGSVRDIVSWASIGVSAIVTTEALCCEVAPALARLGCEVPHCERVVWRVANKRGALSALRGGGPGALLTADGVLGKLVGTPSRDELSYKALGTVDPVRALWDMGFALESVGVECTVNVPAIGGFP